MIDALSRQERFDAGEFARILTDEGVDLRGAQMSEGRALIFSERVTFEHGFGAYLPLMKHTGMRIVVIAPDPEEQALVNRMNEGKPDNEKILILPDLKDLVTVTPPGVTRFYYFKVAGDPVPAEEDQPNITTFDITKYLKQIIASLKKICRLSDDDATALDKVMERFRVIGRAA